MPKRELTTAQIDMLIYEEYAKEFPSSANSQSLDVINKRGGFGPKESIRFLANAVVCLRERVAELEAKAKP